MLLDLIQHIPLWLIFIFTFIIFFIAFEVGVILGKKHRCTEKEEDRSPINSIVAATLGLLAFLLAFTFGFAASKFDERRMLVLEEANAIGTTFLRAEYLEEPHEQKIKNLLKEYVSMRLEAVNLKEYEEAVKRSEILQDRLWQQAVDVAKKNQNSVMVGLFIQSLNEVIDLHSRRISTGLRVRIPIIIWIALYFVAILAIGSVGYQVGLINAKYVGITLLLILTFSSVIMLIIDLDSPQQGFIKVSQESLRELMDKIDEKVQ